MLIAANRATSIPSITFAIVFLFSTTASALPIYVANAGFEDFVLADGEITRNLPPCNSPCVPSSDPVPGWTEIGDVGTFNPSIPYFPSEAPEGQNVAGLHQGSLRQTVSDVLTLGNQYELVVDVGNAIGFPFSNYSVELWAGEFQLDFENNLSPALGSFATSIIEYTPTDADPIGQQLEIRLTSQFLGVNYDNVRLTVVPEPNTALLLSLGLIRIGIRRRAS